MSLRIGGFQSFSTIDYPGQIAAVVFCQGCAWRCVYCHNPQLQTVSSPKEITWESIQSFLKTRIGLLDGVVFSGGEPLCQNYLLEAMEWTRSLGFKVGLHTGGIVPKRFCEVLSVIDWVGLDIKALPEHYNKITGAQNNSNTAWDCLSPLLNQGVSYECRTTVHPTLHTQDDIWNIAQKLHSIGVRHYAIQYFRAQGCAKTELMEYPRLNLEGIQTKLQRLFETFEIR